MGAQAWPGMASAQAQPLYTTTIVYTPGALLYPVGIAVSPSGLMFCTLTWYNGVVSYSAMDGTSRGFVGGNQPGSADGNSTQARFDFPEALAADSAGNVYVADFGNNTIRRIAPGGTVSTLAGIAGTAGFNNGPGSQATFNGLAALACDQAGNVFVSDSNNRAVRRIDASGNVTTLALTALGGQAAGIAVDGNGNIYVGETQSAFAIDKITPAGQVSVLAGQVSAGSADGIGASAQFTSPNALAFDAEGNLLVGDGQTIRAVASNGAVVTVAGVQGEANYPPGPVDGAGPAARFLQINGLAVWGSEVFVADSFGLRRCAMVANTQSPVRVLNISSRGEVSPGSPLVTGFVVQGPAYENVMLRAVGATLSQFGVGNPLPDPQIDLYGGDGALLGTYNPGSNSSPDASTAVLVGAFPVPVNSMGDAVAVVTLPPGAYTAEVNSVSGDSGTVLIEAYEVP